jgi:repressor LexA
MHIKDFERLSKRQQNILRFMQRYITKNGYPPSIREIGEATDINSTSVVNYNLNKLVQAGYVRRDEKVSRGLRLIQSIPGTKQPIRSAPQTISIPLIGQIVASKPAPIPDDHYFDNDDFVDIAPSMLGGVDIEETFALKVKGNSMMDAMIQEGDIIILRHQETADNGDMVAVWLPHDGETTLKYFYREGDNIRLQPAHPTMLPIMVKPKDCQIMGVVLSVVRQLRKGHQ